MPIQLGGLGSDVRESRSNIWSFYPLIWHTREFPLSKIKNRNVWYANPNVTADANSLSTSLWLYWRC